MGKSSFDNHIVIFHCVASRNTFVQKFILFWLDLNTVENV